MVTAFLNWPEPHIMLFGNSLFGNSKTCLAIGITLRTRILGSYPIVA